MNVQNKKALALFFILLAAISVGAGFGDSIYANFYKEVYHIDATQRAFIEFPREMPGLLCAFVIAGLSFLGDIKIAFIAQIFACVGLCALGLFTPSFGVMLLFLFINSLGMHLFMPLQDSIGMALAEPDRVGVRMGQYASLRTGFSFLSAIVVFVGFRSGIFNFTGNTRPVFMVGAIALAVAAVAAFLLIKSTKGMFPPQEKKVRFVFRRQYRYYYMLTILHGVQKQIAFVFGSWVIIDLLGKGADVMSLLVIAGSFCGIFFMRYVGKWLDTLGVKKMMYLDALSFIFVYVLYGFVVWGITAKVLPEAGFSAMIIYVLFVLDRLSMQIGVVKSVYLRQIALTPADITPTLSTGISLDHIVSIVAAQISGIIWATWGPQWVFFFAAFFSLGNLLIAYKLPSDTAKQSS